MFIKAGLNWRIPNALVDREMEWIWPYMDRNLIGGLFQTSSLEVQIVFGS
ncbi:MAG: hypothetical protein AB7S83_03870 [Candidatus Methanomethylophilaceae archaeon]